MEAAVTLFERFGFKKTTMDDIAREVHKAKSSLYYYFGSKEDIFKAAIENEKALLQRRIQLSVEKEHGTKKKLHAFIFERISLVKEYGKLFNIVFAEEYTYLSFINDAKKSFEKFELLIVRNILKEGMERGEVRVLDLNMTAAAAVMAFKGVEAPLSHQVEKFDQELLVDTMVSVLFYGLSKQ